jgi:hypothetical protein
MSTKTLGLAAAGAGLLGFIGYCIYFDRKRRSDPQFKQKLKESEYYLCHRVGVASFRRPSNDVKNGDVSSLSCNT